MCSPELEGSLGRVLTTVSSKELCAFWGSFPAQQGRIRKNTCRNLSEKGAKAVLSWPQHTSLPLTWGYRSSLPNNSPHRASFLPHARQLCGQAMLWRHEMGIRKALQYLPGREVGGCPPATAQEAPGQESCSGWEGWTCSPHQIQHGHCRAGC